MEETEENVVVTNEYENTEEYQEVEEIVTLKEIHHDLGIIACFLIFFTLVIILKYIYKFFNMIFQF